MAETIDELTANYTDETGQQVCQEIDKAVLTRGAWTTVMFLYRDWNKKTEDWDEPKARIERFQKRGGQFRSQSKFRITSAKQAKQIIGILSDWFDSEEEEA